MSETELELCLEPAVIGRTGCAWPAYAPPKPTLADA